MIETWSTERSGLRLYSLSNYPAINIFNVLRSLNSRASRFWNNANHGAEQGNYIDNNSKFPFIHSPYIILLRSLQMDLIQACYLFYKLCPVHRIKDFCNIRIEILTQLKFVARLLLILIIWSKILSLLFNTLSIFAH